MSFEYADLFTIGLLVFLEGILSIDNALALAILAKPLPPKLQKRALTYGLVGAVVFRFLALAFATFLMRWQWVKFVGGGYLLYVGLAHFFKKNNNPAPESKAAQTYNFWKTVLVVELTDIAFAVDSILAAVAVSRKLWVVFTGGVIGLIMMRFAATIFISLLKKYPNFETSAYLMIVVVGLKLVIDGFQIPQINFHSVRSVGFWLFWVAVIVCIGIGFLKREQSRKLDEMMDLTKEKKGD